jgi:hypothetical protein
MRAGQATAELQQSYRKEMKERRRLFNIIQELKGNIRVYCRVRPLSPEEERGKGGVSRARVSTCARACERSVPCAQVITFPEEGLLRVFNPGTSLPAAALS